MSFMLGPNRDCKPCLIKWSRICNTVVFLYLYDWTICGLCGTCCLSDQDRLLISLYCSDIFVEISDKELLQNTAASLWFTFVQTTRDAANRVCALIMELKLKSALDEESWQNCRACVTVPSNTICAGYLVAVLRNRLCSSKYCCFYSAARGGSFVYASCNGPVTLKERPPIESQFSNCELFVCTRQDRLGCNCCHSKVWFLISSMSFVAFISVLTPLDDRSRLQLK